MYFEATPFTCSLKLWFRELGFTVSYGALLLKTWRVHLVFAVKSATQVKVSDSDLLKRLAILVAVVILFLSARMVWGQPTVEEGEEIRIVCVIILSCPNRTLLFKLPKIVQRCGVGQLMTLFTGQPVLGFC